MQLLAFCFHFRLEVFACCCVGSHSFFRPHVNYLGWMLLLRWQNGDLIIEHINKPTLYSVSQMLVPNSSLEVFSGEGGGGTQLAPESQQLSRLVFCHYNNNQSNTEVSAVLSRRPQIQFAFCFVKQICIEPMLICSDLLVNWVPRTFFFFPFSGN